MKLFNHIQAFLKDEEGASALEYALMAFMVAAAVATFTTPIRTAIIKIFTDLQTAMSKV